MAIKVVTEFIARATIVVLAYVRDRDTDALADPTSIKVSIWDPAATKKVDAASMTKLSTGTYEYDYETAADSTTGHWRGEVVVTDGAAPAIVTISTFSFRLK